MTTFFIATKHPEYAEREYPVGSTVIDPWRYIPDQLGVTVRRLGENKPALISILCPTRGRPVEFLRLVQSVISTATHRRAIEIIAYLDEDDEDSYQPRLLGVRYVVGPRILLSEAWNECYRVSSGEILMHCGDDIVFRTLGWDVVVRRAFEDFPDRIVLVHGDDGGANTAELATHSFLHRRWVETVGYFVPPLFSSDFNDVWLTEVADAIGRRVQVPILTEHMHYSFGKGPYDETHRERVERGREDRVDELYAERVADREADAEKLRAAMSVSHDREKS